jgi:DNA-binding HxlR family transcriptional regulator
VPLRPTPVRRGSTIDDQGCRSFQPVIELIGRRWTAAVLLAGERGARRFGQYRTLVPGISDRLLSQRLKDLERHGLMERTVIPSTPVEIRHSPTERGRGLIVALQPLIDWSLDGPSLLAGDDPTG